jgi:hypothetical protein
MSRVSKGRAGFHMYVKTVQASAFRISHFTNPDFLRKAFDVMSMGG